MEARLKIQPELRASKDSEETDRTSKETTRRSKKSSQVKAGVEAPPIMMRLGAEAGRLSVSAERRRRDEQSRPNLT